MTVTIGAKADVLIEVLPYIQQYEHATFVIKYGGAAMVEEELGETFAQDVTLLRKIGVQVVIVPKINAGGFRMMNEGESIHPIFSSPASPENSSSSLPSPAPKEGEGAFRSIRNAELYEPRIPHIKRVLESLALGRRPGLPGRLH